MLIADKIARPSSHRRLHMFLYVLHASLAPNLYRHFTEHCIQLHWNSCVLILIQTETLVTQIKAIEVTQCKRVKIVYGVIDAWRPFYNYRSMKHSLDDVWVSRWSLESHQFYFPQIGVVNRTSHQLHWFAGKLFDNFIK